MEHYKMLNDILVNLFNEILGIEEKALTSSEFRDISVNDMHILEAVGTEEPRSMSSVAKSLSVTVGILTIAMNNLVKKGYVNRARSEEDRRVVLISLSEKGEKAYYHHQKFHDDMIQAIMTDLDETQMDALTQALNKLRAFFRKY
mgnify:FL=1